MFIAETSKALKRIELVDILSDIELQTSKGVVAVACRPSDSAGVQIGCRVADTNSFWEGSASEMIRDAQSNISGKNLRLTATRISLISGNKPW